MENVVKQTGNPQQPSATDMLQYGLPQRVIVRVGSSIHHHSGESPLGRALGSQPTAEIPIQAPGPF